MILISHRGNLNGRLESSENEPRYIDHAIKEGYDVEIDVWCIDDTLYLGHDRPQYEIEIKWLLDRIDNLWIHCKNIYALVYLKVSGYKLNYFWHENDTVTITSNNFIWAFLGKQPIKNSIAVLPEVYNDDLSACMGICSDFISKYKKKVRIALCIGNLAAKGRYGNDAYIKGYHHLKENILDKYDNVDVFCHSYEIELKNDILNLYSPVSYFFEEAPNFDSEFKDLNNGYTNFGSQETLNYQNMFSMAYSRYMVGQLKSNYEKKHKFVYDWVIFVRYDISAAPHIEQISFDKNLDSNYLYTCMFQQLNAGPQDQWFYSNSKNMDIVFSLFLNLKEYFSINSKLGIKAENEWIDSNMDNRFSCELLREKKLKTKFGEKMPRGAISNGHVVYKWHLNKYNLWNLNKLRFIITNFRKDVTFTPESHENIIRLY